jgi:gamma-glutamyltranspeptidase / glutathione hydrolase
MLCRRCQCKDRSQKDAMIRNPVNARSLRIALMSRAVASVLLMSIADGAAAAPGGMVVTEQNLATAVGAGILRKGGNAVDAAVAVGYAEAVVYPCCGNIGGGGFMLIHLARGGDYFLDFRERAPLAARGDMYLDATGKPIADASLIGWRAAGVPGTVMGLETARRRFGRLSRAQDMAPAIELARKGFVLDAHGAAFINAATHLADDPAAAHIFRGPGGAPLAAGERLVQPELAQLLEQISEDGTPAFYQGALPRRIEAAARAQDGLLTTRDFAAYRAIWRGPVRCYYRGYDIISAPPPSSGGTAVCEVLNILQLHDMRALGFHSPAALQIFAEAERHAFLDRNFALGDPDFMSNDVVRLISPDYAAAINATILPGHAMSSASLPPGTPPHEKYETTQYSITDGAGNGVSVTYTLNGRFGAQVMAPGTGFLMNDEMDDFTTVPGEANMFGLRQGARNAIAPGKRPLSSMAPTMVTRDGKLAMVLGSPNGSRIISVVLQVLMNTIDYQMSPEQAVSAPRVHEQYLPDVLFTEPDALNPATVQSLQRMGYTIQTIPPFGAAETIEKCSGRWIGINDPRSPDGSAAGG